MDRNLKTALFAALTLLVTVSAAAAQGMPMRGHHSGGGMGFWRMDANGDGVVSLKEYLRARSHRFDRLDADEDDKVTTEEIDDFIIRRLERIRRRMLDRFDANDDGVISRAEFERFHAKRFALSDRDDDGKVSRAERRKVMRGRMHRHRMHRMGRMHGMRGMGMPGMRGMRGMYGMRGMDDMHGGPYKRSERGMEMRKFDGDDDDRLPAGAPSGAMRKMHKGGSGGSGSDDGESGKTGSGKAGPDEGGSGSDTE